MKKYIKLILIIIAILLIFIIPTDSMAATYSFDASPTDVEVGDTVKITVKVTAAQWNLTLTANGKEVESWKETQNFEKNLTNTFTASYKATEKGTINFVLSGDISDVDTSNPNFNTEINTSKSVTVKEKETSGENTSSGGSTSSGNNNTTGSNSSDNKDTTQKTPTFTTVNRTVYTTGQVNLRSSWSTSSSAISVAKGTELTLTGTSTEKINGYVWYRVSYKGNTKYVASSLVTSTKPEEEKKSDNNNLSSLEIEGITLTPEFSEDVLQYTANVGEEIDNIEINAELESSKAELEIEGNENLKQGENTVRITVTAEDGTTKTYTIKVIKGEETIEAITPTDNNLKLSELQIAGVDFEDGFNPDLYSYELTLNIAIQNLDITATPNQADAKVEIVGNENFVEGQNIVMILLTSADGEQTATYQIKVNMPVTATETQHNIQFYIMCAGASIALIILLIIIIAVCRRKNRKELYEDEEEDIQGNEDFGRKGSEKDVQDTNSDKKIALDEFLNNSEIQEKPRRSKGKHSV